MNNLAVIEDNISNNADRQNFKLKNQNWHQLDSTDLYFAVERATNDERQYKTTDLFPTLFFPTTQFLDLH